MKRDKGWDIHPGDWVELADGRRGAVTRTCTLIAADVVIGVEVLFEWVLVDDLASWTPGN